MSSFKSIQIRLAITTLATLAIAILAIVPAIAGQVQLELTGANRQIEKQIRASVNLPGARSLQRPGRLKKLALQATNSLQAIGYYESSITPSMRKRTLTSPTDGRSSDTYGDAGELATVVSFAVKPGRVTYINSLIIDIDGDQQSREILADAIAALPLRRGDILRHDKYEETKDALFNQAQSNGYLEARYEESRVAVDKSRASADVYLKLFTGPRYRFGKVNFSENQLGQHQLQRWVPFPPGEPYDSIKLHELSDNLQNSGYFQQVSVKPDMANANDGIVPINVELQPAAPNEVNVGAGFATDSGARFQFKWTRPYHNRHGDALQVNSSHSNQRQQITVGMRRPDKRNPTTDSLKLNLGLLNYRTPDTFSKQRTLELVDRKLKSGKWYRDIILRWEHEEFKFSDSSLSTTLVLPGFALSKTVTSHQVYPRFGFNLEARVLMGSQNIFSDIDLYRFTTSAKILRTAGNRHRLIGGLHLGALDTNDFNRVPITHRFFTGGHGSVRGYSYQSIAAQDDSGQLIGGRYLSVASIEYEYQVLDKWALATFVDSGRANIESDEKFRTGVGVGLRWSSPVGPIRLDLAKPLDSDSESVRFHVAIGPLF